MTAYLYENDTLLCQSLPSYGTGATGEIGNEPGYINAMSTCTFNPPLRMKTTDKIEVIGKYYANQAHSGVMSLFYIAMADVQDDQNESSGTRSGASFFVRFQGIAVTFAFMIVTVATLKVFQKYHLRREGYERVHSHSLVV